MAAGQLDSRCSGWSNAWWSASRGAGARQSARSFGSSQRNVQAAAGDSQPPHPLISDGSDSSSRPASLDAKLPPPAAARATAELSARLLSHLVPAGTLPKGHTPTCPVLMPGNHACAAALNLRRACP